jgi:hypothetical protein
MRAIAILAAAILLAATSTAACADSPAWLKGPATGGRDAPLIINPNKPYGQIVSQQQTPYWQAGARDADLSGACSRGEFGEVRALYFRAVFTGKDGEAVLGVAKGSGVNLHDPKRRARKNQDYFFYRSGTSGCQVFSAPAKKR